MTTQSHDYSLVGESGRRAVESGLASAEWYHSEIPRKTMKELMKRSDSPAIRDTFIWLGLMLIFAACAIALWPSGWSALFSSPMACCMAQPRIRAGMNAGTAPPSAPAG